jgi:TonB-dependent Receptor Plug Domain
MKPVFLLLLLFKVNLLLSQSSTFIISGEVRDKTTGETLPYSSIWLNQINRSSADQLGHFSIVVSKEKPQVFRVTSLGFMPFDTILDVKTSVFLTILLNPLELKGVEVVANSGEIKHNETQISVERLKAIPALLGQPDLIKALQFLPGVSGGLEGTTGLYVRGGTSDQNLILIDDAVVYNSSHLFGFQSIFDPNAIKSIRLIKGGFPARYGGRLSSVVDITMKEGNNLQRKKALSLGLINSGVLLEGPIKKGKSSFLFTARTAYLGLLLFPFKQSAEKKKQGSNNLLNYDINFKYNTSTKKYGNFFASTYLGNDLLSDHYRAGNIFSKRDIQWGNKTVSLRHVKSIKSIGFVTSLLNFNQYQLKETLETQRIDPSLNVEKNQTSSKVQDISWKQRFSFNLLTSLNTVLGYEVTKSQMQPFVNETTLSDTISAAFEKKYRIGSLAFFIENNIRLSKHLKADLGIRYSHYQSGKKRQYWEPRANLTYDLGQFSTNIGFASSTQYIHLLANNSLGLVSDLWVPSTSLVAPEQATQFSGGIIFRSKESGIEASLEAYWKNMNNLIDYRQGTNFLDPRYPSWESAIVTGAKGRAYGIETMLKKEAKRYSGWISYTLSKSERQSNFVNNGLWYPFKYDRKHNLNLTGVYKMKKNWQMGFSFIYQTGARLTLPVADMNTYDLVTEDLVDQSNSGVYDVYHIYKGRNNAKLPPFHRADISFTKTFKTKRKNNDADLIFSVYNLYNRKNPYYISVSRSQSLNDNGTYSQNIKVSGRALFSIIPSISYNLKW